MNRHIIYVLIILNIICCSNAEAQHKIHTGPLKRYCTSDMKIKYYYLDDPEGDRILDGQFRCYNSEGDNYRGNMKDGLCDGDWIYTEVFSTYFNELRIHYTNGVPDGEFSFISAPKSYLKSPHSTQLKKATTIITGNIKNGVASGPFSSYEYGTTTTGQFDDDGHPIGTWKLSDKNDPGYLECKYDETGKMISSRLYDSTLLAFENTTMDIAKTSLYIFEAIGNYQTLGGYQMPGDYHIGIGSYGVKVSRPEDESYW